MVQRKVPNKLSIKPLLLKSNSQSPNLTPPSPKPHDHLKKIMKKPRPTTTTTTTRSFNSQPPAPVRKKRTHDAVAGAKAKASPQKQSPNYMKSTTSFEARKEQKTQTHGSNSKTSSLKAVRTLAKNSSFKPLKPSKKCSSLMLSARRTTCSSTLKDSKFPSYLELSHGGTELEGKSVMKVCPYNYCSLNGHHHAPVPPLRCFLSARRRALKNQKSFKLGCLSPRQTKIAVKKNEQIDGEHAEMEVTPVTPVMEENEEEENRDFFVEIYSKREDDLECSAMDWEEGYCSSSSSSKSPEIEKDDDEKTQKIGFDSLYGAHQELYDEESVSSGAWSESSEGDYDYESVNLHQETKINDQNIDEDENTGFEAKADEVEALDIPTGESETLPDFGGKSAERTESTDKHHTTVIYNIIQYNISIFINGGEKTEFSETDRPVKVVSVKVPANSGDENQKASDKLPASVEDNESTEQLDISCLTYTQEDPESEDDENQACIRSNSMDFDSDKKSEIDEELESTKPEISGEELPESMDEEPATRYEEKPAISGESSVNLKESTRMKKTEKEMEESGEFNLRGPNFLPEVADPDAETVDLKHQAMDERKNAEEWMVDFALQQAVTTLAPARKKKVALLVEAF